MNGSPFGFIIKLYNFIKNLIVAIIPILRFLILSALCSLIIVYIWDALESTNPPLLGEILVFVIIFVFLFVGGVKTAG